jgi:secreted trypsin-like serine protease
VGIVSYGIPECAAKNSPDVFTRISYFYDWIASHIQDNNETMTSVNKTISYPVHYQCYQYQAHCSCSGRNVVLSPSEISRSENALPYT